MKHLYQLLLLFSCASMFVSCIGMHSTLPEGVTDPDAIRVYENARKGDAKAMYLMSKIYRHGLYGFPKSETRADTILKNAADAKPPCPEACYDIFVNYIRDGSEYRGRKGIDYFCEALRNSEPRALEFVREVSEDTWSSRDQAKVARDILRERDIKEFGYLPCPVCKGSGTQFSYTAPSKVTTYYGDGSKTVEHHYGSSRHSRCTYCSMPWRRTPYKGYIKP